MTVPQAALAYLLNQPLTVFPIVGAASENEIKEIAETVDIKLTDMECERLENL